MNNSPHEVYSAIVSPSDTALLCGLYRKALDQMAECHTDYGLEVSNSGTYSKQLWMRDAGVGALGAHPGAIRKTIKSFLKYQLPSGEIPYRIERVHHVRRFWLAWTKKFGVDLVNRSEPLPIFRHSRYAVGAADTVPIVTMSFAQTYVGNDVDAAIIAKLDHAIQFEEGAFFNGKLALFNLPPVSDWMDDISVGGYRSFTNILWWRAYAAMRRFHHGMQTRTKVDSIAAFHRSQAMMYRERCVSMHGAIREHLVHPNGYVMAGIGDDRADTASSVMYAVFNPSRQAGRKVLAAINHLRTPSGFLRNFDRGYPSSQYRFWFKFFGFTKFANTHVYPWHNHLELMRRIQLMDVYSETEVRETLGLIMQAARMHQQNGDFHEVVTDDEGRPATHTVLGLRVYTSTAGFLASVGTWIAAMDALAKSYGKTPETFFGVSQPPLQ